MIIVTGAAGFIGSCLLRKLNDEGLSNIVAVDEFSRVDKRHNLAGKNCRSMFHRDEFPDWLEAHAAQVEFVFHLGARTDTTEQDTDIFDRLNLHYSQRIWQICTRHCIPLVYASSAATYGAGEHGYDDRHDIVPALRPLNPYGQSKNDFDLWALQQTGKLSAPPFWAGLKFFNVYGPNEYHKEEQISVVLKNFREVDAGGPAVLFRSHNPEFPDGGQKRDFVWVGDCVTVMLWLLDNPGVNGMFNLGTGSARSFAELAAALFDALGRPADIKYVDTPEAIREKYQYFTEARMMRLRAARFDAPFTSLEEGVTRYVAEYLATNDHYL